MHILDNAEHLIKTQLGIHIRSKKKMMLHHMRHSITFNYIVIYNYFFISCFQAPSTRTISNFCSSFDPSPYTIS